MTLDRKPVVLVTGAGTGIGAAIAELAAATGARVAICGRRREPLEKVADATGAIPYTADVTSPADVEQLVSQVVDEHGRLDGVVANAGVMRPGSVLDLTQQDWDATVRTNLTALFLLARCALPHLVESRGAWVTVSSVAGLRAPTGAAAYAASKAGAAMLTQCIAADYGPRGVRANAVCPGWTRTEMADEEMREFGEPLGLDREEAYAQVTHVVPQRRPAAASEIADAVLWLLGPRSSYVNAAVLTVDGGTTAIDPGTIPFDFDVALRATRP
ncbi:NAD(P)-dependent dehydrogenase (short-subunit alcohol dehydrogenase family) [Streptomyces griseochromogenes]|uniref:Dehydrogenase n=1 Tax=Streptomyces griseochromogenes TaxID=68214 RepID=A0A1B1AV73_9ACTN|nr:SDR family oxidoreductase [Streptomyces griseochromogenes]ANP50488.1 dehydrogenase [Streptomyces griseochromogenes]MBP2051241.1 NAD(P)-dependent dehydrogenase (short-subunit alcohol dehydrogenase family) [Streptomyces griseochromogenes]